MIIPRTSTKFGHVPPETGSVVETAAGLIMSPRRETRLLVGSKLAVNITSPIPPQTSDYSVLNTTWVRDDKGKVGAIINRVKEMLLIAMADDDQLSIKLKRASLSGVDATSVATRRITGHHPPSNHIITTARYGRFLERWRLATLVGEVDYHWLMVMTLDHLPVVRDVEEKLKDIRARPYMTVFNHSLQDTINSS